MINKVEFSYESHDKKTRINAIKWIPEGEIIALLQISHGMLEYVDRYDKFARSLSQQGILVFGNDHLGHGKSILNEDDRGFFSEDDGNLSVIEDMHRLRALVCDEYKNIPYFLLGHSMGSFLVRQYISIYNDEEIDGAIVVGTGYQSKSLILFGKYLTQLMSLFKGWRYRSKFVDKLVLGDNNNKFEPARTRVDWLSRDEEIVDEYLNDKKISFIFTLNGFYNMFKGMLELYDTNNLRKIPKNLPIFILSGEMDPVGKFGKDIENLYKSYKELGLKEVSYKLYKDFRHEIINEINNEIVYKDILEWIKQKL